MAENIQPFYRVPPADSQGHWSKWATRLMRAHFALTGVVLFVSGMALLAYLFSLEFNRLDLRWNLRIESAGDIYRAEVQLRMAVALALVLISLLFFQAVGALSQRGGKTVLLVRLAATLLAVSLPAGAALWWRMDQSAGLGVAAQLLQDVQTGVRIIALLLIGQGALALLYWAISIRCSFGVPAESAVTAHGLWQRRVRRLAIVLALGGLLGLGGTLAVLTDWLLELPVTRPEPGQLLYATTFDDFNDEWDLYAGRDAAQVQAIPTEGTQPDPALVIVYGSGAPDEVVWSSLDRKFNDFDLRVTARLLDGPVDQNQFGVVFRYRDENNFYIFRISADGYYSLGKVRAGVQEKISDWGVTDLIHQGGAPNEIRVIGYGNRFLFYINGQPVPLCLRGENETSMWANWEGPGICYTAEPTTVFRDGAFAQGRIALAAGTIDGSDVVVAFDDVILTGPDPAAFDEE